MTLPFRGRHHDGEATHDRARALVSRQMLEELGSDEASWLTRHLDDCAECRRDRDAYLADRDMLRSLRDKAPEAPRDLWAKTSAALDREASRRRRGAAPSADPGPARARWRRLPLGAVAGALIVAVVIGVSIFPRAVPITPPTGTGGVAVASPVANPTSMAVVAANITWIQSLPDGTLGLFVADIDEVCPRAKSDCHSLDVNGPARPVDLGSAASNVTISPNDDQLVVIAPGDALQPGKVLVIPVPSTGTGATPPPQTPSPPTEPAGTPPSGPPTTSPASPELPTVEPTIVVPTPAATPTGAVEIASGVTVVGDAAYSADGRWLAFSARPSDGSTGPDLYLWSVGDASARAVTTDHSTYFSAWYGDRVLASHVAPSLVPSASPDPLATTGVAPAVDPSQPLESPIATLGEAHPTSFLLDPATLARTDFAQPDIWLPVVDPTGRFVAFWSGTLRPTDGDDWELGTGDLVLDGWSAGPDAPSTPGASPDASATVTPASTSDATASGVPSATGAPAAGPVGTPRPIATGRTSSFKVRFDPDGTRLAVWVAEERDATVGRLHLVVLDRETGEIDTANAPLPGAPALRRFSIDEGRLAWVSPRGQDGNESAVKVLGWLGKDFGEIQTIPGRDLYIVR